MKVLQLAIWTFVVLILIGWVMNLISLLHMSFDPLTGMAVLKVVGIFLVPVGGVVGWF
tara:strand:- start:12359 stop:12532 length:174 start_codon:yes stop_codon:yes gene_type:complete